MNRSIRSRNQLIKQLLRKARKEGREQQMVLLIQWRLAAVNRYVEDDLELIEQLKYEGSTQPRAVKLLNALSRLNGSSSRFFYSETVVSDSPNTLQ